MTRRLRPSFFESLVRREIYTMWILEYIVNDSDVRESYTFPTRDLAYWKKYDLENQGNHTYGKFRIRKG
jgi:hypothetical protein